MKTLNKVTGRIGEAEAERLLTGKGMKVIERNFSTKYGEIDLICEDGGIIVFVEVKTKKGTGFGSPEEMFTRGKLNRVKRMATLYLGGREAKCRIDMVAVVLDGNDMPVRVKHYENVG